VQEGLAWRVIGRLPASGEGADVTDVDNDGHPDLCLATGYSATRAAILVYSIGEESLAKEPKIVIDEDHRYGTVRFLAGPMVPDGSRELFAWWCTGLGEGQTEVVRYRLDNGRMISRESIAWSEDATMWPIDGQMAIADLNADGNGEVWFASSCGNVYRYAPAEQSNITLACSIAGGIGPITSGGIKGRPCIYLSSGNRLLQLSPSGQAH
jgi:hypothetical protein